MKSFLPVVLVLIFAGAAMAEEAAGEHGEKKPPPPKPSKGTPVEDVLKLPAVAAWTKWVSSYKGTMLNAWGESINTVEGQKCWGVAVGEALPGDKVRIWRRFCVPLDGSEIWVESLPSPDAETTYKPYGKWADECKPTEKSEGSC